jgi:hypothetical protein
MSNENDKSKSDDWEMTAPNVNVPKREKPDDWSMPAPVFRVSEGEKIDNLPKRSLNFNQSEASASDKTALSFNLSEFSPPYPYNSAAPKPSPANQSAAVRKTETAPGSKLIYVLGGLILMLFLAIVALAGVYFLILYKP